MPIKVPFTATITEWSPKVMKSIPKSYAQCKLSTGHIINIVAENAGFLSQYRQYFGGEMPLFKSGAEFTQALDKIMKMRCVFNFVYEIKQGKKEYENTLFGEVRFGTFENLPGWRL